MAAAAALVGLGRIKKPKDRLYDFFLALPEDAVPIEGNALKLFPPTSKFRKTVYAIMHARVTEAIVLTVIAINIAMLCLLDYRLLVEGGILYQMNFIVDVVVTGLFTVEMLCHWVARGAFFGRYAYIKNKWMLLDFVIVIASIAEIITTVVRIYYPSLGKIPTKMLSVLRAFRTLRPLRSFKFFQGIRAVLDAVAEARSLISNVLFFLGFGIIFFGIVAVEAFGNSLSRRCVAWVG